MHVSKMIRYGIVAATIGLLSAGASAGIPVVEGPLWSSPCENRYLAERTGTKVARLVKLPDHFEPFECKLRIGQTLITLDNLESGGERGGGPTGVLVSLIGKECRGALVVFQPQQIEITDRPVKGVIDEEWPLQCNDAKWW